MSLPLSQEMPDLMPDHLRSDSKTFDACSTAQGNGSGIDQNVGLFQPLTGASPLIIISGEVAFLPKSVNRCDAALPKSMPFLPGGIS